MTREEQIDKAALDYCGYDTETVYAHIENAFIAGAEWADSHTNWISVDDELPPKQPNRERSKNVLVRTNSGRTQIEYYDYGNDVIKEWWKYHVTHWMPLPAPPTCSVKPNNCTKGGEK